MPPCQQNMSFCLHYYNNIIMLSQPEPYNQEVKQDRNLEELQENNLDKGGCKSSVEFITHYNSFFAQEKLTQIDQQNLNRIIKVITSNEIDYSPQQQFSQTSHVKIVNHSNDYQILELQIKIGHFTFKNISVLNLNTNFPINLVGNRKQGSFANVYRFNFNGEALALKTVEFQRNFMNQVIHKDIGYKLQLLIKEYCLTKLASVLEVGPKTNQMGFNILVYKDCAAFPMEYCLDINTLPNLTLAQYCKQLKKQLYRLHSLKFIHLDIKEQNICFSTIKNQLVFIDYGLSKILKQPHGDKTITYYLGTPTYCSDEMNALFLTEQSSYIDLYYNDVVCLEKTFKNQQEKWTKIILQVEAGEFGDEKSGEASKPGVKKKTYQQTLVIPYIKYLAYQLKFQQFQLCVKNNWNEINKIEFNEIILFMKRMSLSISNFLFFKYTSNETKSIFFQNDHPNLSSKQNEQSNKDICLIINGFSQEDEGEKIAIHLNPILFDLERCVKLDWRIYVKQVVKAIQINSNTCRYQQKVKIAKITKAIISKSFIPQMKAVEPFIKAKYSNDLQEVSVMLLGYSVSGALDNLKICIFHSMIYNVILLELCEQSIILEIYKMVCLLNIDFNEKMRMLLRMKCTIFWKHYYINLSFSQRISLIKQFDEFIRAHQNEFCQSMQQDQRQFFKIVNMGFIFNQNETNKAILQTTYKMLAEKDKFVRFLENKSLQRQLKMWLICNISCMDEYSQYKKELQKIIIYQSNKVQICFDYYHLVFFPCRGQIDQAKMAWVADLFIKIFQGVNIILQRYQFQILKMGILLQKDCYKNYHQFLKALVQQKRLQRIHPFSIYGSLIHKFIHSIILNQSINALPTKFQSIYIDNQQNLSRYVFDIHQQVIQKCIVYNLELMLKEKVIYDREEVYLRDRKKMAERWVHVYNNLKKRILSIKQTKIINYGLVMLNLILSQILSLKKHYEPQFMLLNHTVKTVQFMKQQRQIFRDTREIIVYYFMKIIISSDIRKNMRINVAQPVYLKFYSILQERKVFHHYLSDRFVFLQIFFYLMATDKKKVPGFIDSVSKSIILTNSQSTAQVYYLAFNLAIYLVNWNSLLKKSHLSGNILKNLSPINDNPYNGVYIHTLMCFPQLWSKQNFIKITNCFKYIHRSIISLILPNYYKYNLLFFMDEYKERKKKRLICQSMKYNYQEKIGLGAVIEVTAKSCRGCYWDIRRVEYVNEKLRRFYHTR